MKHFDVAVIGGGILGCFAGRSLLRYDLTAAIFEAREDLCTGVTRANTAAIYAGYDMKPGTLKTRLCVEGSRNFEKLCTELGVRYKRCGSIMVCFGESGAKVLEKKYRRGIENGVEGMKLLSKEEVHALEPEISPDIYMGLYAPYSGTADPWELGLAAAENFLANGGEILKNCPVTAIEKTPDGYRLITPNGEYTARAVINCAGLFADEVREMTNPPQVRIFPEKCDYVVLDTTQSNLVNHVIFFEPEEKEKGLTLVPTVDGNILIGGSTVSASDKAENLTTVEGLEKVITQAKEIFPALSAESIIRSFAAIRPNPWAVIADEKGEFIKDGGSINDFTVLDDGDFISFIGIKTPGLTCAEGLGRLAADKIAAAIGKTAPNADFDPVRPPETRFANISREEQAKLIAADSAWGRMVCHCRHVTEAEVIAAIRAGAVTLDGVKRRTGAGMGRCQGAGCSMKIIQLLSQQLGIPASEIKKDSHGSKMIFKR